MTFTVETGSGNPAATSYTSVEFADAYFATRGEPAWAGETALKQQALVRATRALDLQYGPQYASSSPATSTQALLWPRAAFVDRYHRNRPAGVVPVEIQRATSELALKSLQGDSIFPEPVAERFITERSVKLDVISETVKYSQPISSLFLSGFREIELILWAVLRDTTPRVTRFGL